MFLRCLQDLDNLYGISFSWKYLMHFSEREIKNAQALFLALTRFKSFFWNFQKSFRNIFRRFSKKSTVLTTAAWNFQQKFHQEFIHKFPLRRGALLDFILENFQELFLGIFNLILLKFFISSFWENFRSSLQDFLVESLGVVQEFLKKCLDQFFLKRSSRWNPTISS